MRYKCIIIFIAFFAILICGCEKKASGPENDLIIAVPGWYMPEKVPALGAVADKWNQSGRSKKVLIKPIFGKKDSVRHKALIGLGRKDFADAVLVRNEWIGGMAARGLLRPLGKGAAEIQKYLPESIRESVTGKGSLWAVPFDMDIMVLWYRKDLWPDGIKAAAADHGIPSKPKHAQSGMYTFAFPASEAMTTAHSYFPWYLSAGGRFKDDSGALILDAEAARKALAILQGAVSKGLAPKHVGALNQSKIFSGLAGGAYGMTVGGSWERAMLESQSRHSVNIAAADNIVTTLAGGWSFVIGVNSDPDIDKVLPHFFSRETQIAKLHGNRLLPANTRCLGDRWFIENEDGPAFKQAITNGCSLPFSDKTDLYVERIALMIAQVFLKGASPGEAALTAKSDIASFGKVE